MARSAEIDAPGTNLTLTCDILIYTSTPVPVLQERDNNRTRVLLAAYYTTEDSDPSAYANSYIRSYSR